MFKAGSKHKVLKSLYIGIEQVDKLKELSRITRVPQAVYIREAVDMLLKKYEKELNSRG